MDVASELLTSRTRNDADMLQAMPSPFVTFFVMIMKSTMKRRIIIKIMSSHYLVPDHIQTMIQIHFGSWFAEGGQQDFVLRSDVSAHAY